MQRMNRARLSRRNLSTLGLRVSSALLLALVAPIARAEVAPHFQLQIGQDGYRAALSPDGKYAVSASNDSNLKLWDLASGRELRDFAGHALFATDLSFSSDGKTVVSGSLDATIKLWDISSGKELRVFRPDSSVNKVALSPDQRTIASSSIRTENPLELWDVASNQLRTRFGGPGDGEKALAISPGGDAVLSISKEGTMKVWDMATGKEAWRSGDPGAAIVCAAFSPDGKTIVSGTASGAVAIRDASDGAELRSFIGHKKEILSLVFMTDGRTLLSTSKDETVKLWDSSDGKPISSFWSFAVKCCGIIPDGAYALMVDVSANSGLQLFNLKTGKIDRRYQGHCTPINGIAVSPDGKFAVSAASSGILRYWDFANLRQSYAAGSLSAYPVGMDCAAFSPDGKSVLVSSYEILECWDFEAKRQVNFRIAHDDPKVPAKPIVAVAYSSDGKMALSASSDNSIRLYEKGDNGITEKRRFEGHVGVPRFVAFTPDGKTAVSGAVDGTVRLWDIKSGKLKKSIEVGKGRITNCFAVSPDGKSFLVGYYGAPPALWSLSGGRKMRDLKAPAYSNTESAAFSPDGKTVLVGGRDGSLVSYSLSDGRELRRYEGTPTSITGILFGPGGKTAFTASTDGAMRRIELDSGEWIAFASTSPVFLDSRTKWLIYSSDGYWDGSPDCGELVAMVRGLEAWNIDQFAVRNNRPDILAARLGAKEEVVAEFKAAWEKRLRRLGLDAAGLGDGYGVPTVAIESAVQDGKFVDLSLRFEAKGKSLLRYQVYVNDVPLYGAAGKSLSGESAAASERVELAAGDNKVEASCMDSGGVESFRTNRMFAWREKTKPDLYFLGFGVSEYADPGIRDLRYAAKDALALQDLFKGMGGKEFGGVYSRVYVDGQVTREAVSTAKDFLKEARVDDTFVLFISGHGVQVGGVSKLVGQAAGGKGLAVVAAAQGKTVGMTYFYVTSDAKLSDIASTAVDFDTIEELLQDIAPRKKLFLMDTCESGEADGTRQAGSASGTKGLYARTLSQESVRGIAVLPVGATSVNQQKDRYVYNDLVRRSGAIVFSSSRGNEASLESDQWKQGAFTYSILRALRDKAADRDKDGEISTDELRDYVIDAVPRLVKTLDSSAEQHPTVDRDNLYAKFGFPMMK
jgi:WD40 repeat protein